MLPLPSMPPTPNERTLAAKFVDRFTGLLSTNIPLSQTAIEGYEQVFKNGLLLDPATDYTITGNQITLTAAAVSADKFLIHYRYRQT